MAAYDRNPSSESEVSNADRDVAGDLPNMTSDSETGGSSRASSSVGRVVSSGGDAGLRVVPVERQSTLVLQGFFEGSGDEEHSSNVRSIFDTLEGSGRRTDNEEVFLQLGLEINRASWSLQARYQEEFEQMMSSVDFGASVQDVLSNLAEIATRLFSNPSHISWSSILVYFSFASWVIIKKGLETLKDIWTKVVNTLNDFSIVKWVKEKGGWVANRDAIQDVIQRDLERQTSVADRMRRDSRDGGTSIEIPGGGAGNSQDTTDGDNSNSNNTLYLALTGGAVCVATIAVVGALLWNRRS